MRMLRTIGAPRWPAAALTSATSTCAGSCAAARASGSAVANATRSARRNLRTLKAVPQPHDELRRVAPIRERLGDVEAEVVQVDAGAGVVLEGVERRERRRRIPELAKALAREPSAPAIRERHERDLSIDAEALCAIRVLASKEAN